MGKETSNYLRASVLTMRTGYPEWMRVYARGEDPDGMPDELWSKVRKAESAWSVEVGVAAVEMYADGYNNRARLQCQALVRYVAKAPKHDSLAQAVDIAVSLGAYINHGTMVDADGAVGEIVQDVRVYTEVETVNRGGVRAATGGYQVILQWADETVVSPDIEIADYAVQSPTAPAGQPDVGDIDGCIDSIDLTVPFPPDGPDGDAVSILGRAEIEDPNGLRDELAELERCEADPLYILMDAQEERLAWLRELIARWDEDSP